MIINQTHLDVGFQAFRDNLLAAKQAWIKRKVELQGLIDARPLLLFGFGGKGKMLAYQIRHYANRDVTVFDMNSKTREDARNQGFPIIDRLEKPNSKWAAILGACQAQLQQSEIVGSDFIFYQEAANILEAPHLAHLARDFEIFVAENIESLYHVHNLLHPASRECFIQLLCFRLTGNSTYLKNVRQHVSQMWLDKPEVYRKRDYKTFLDVGAFDGDTLRVFNNRFGCIRGIAVEANTSLHDAIHGIGSLYPQGIKILPVAAWSHATKLQFNEVRSGMITVTESIDGDLAAAPIDQYVEEPVDCIKMDIEGSEISALKGCARLVERFRPDLALAAYHQPNDLISLITISRELGYDQDQFDWHFSHYSDCLDDSIYYVLRKL